MKNNIFKKFFIILICFCMLSFTACKEKVITPNLVKNADLTTSSYALGDFMGDYSVTDINGKTYTFSELLKTKKAIVLNFWYIDCIPCNMEFPYLQAAADTYSENVAVIAINPTTDKEKAIKKYAQENKLTFPVVKGPEAWITAFGIQAFPATVVIDRYGVVSFYHVGTITQDGVFEKLFKTFTARNYKQTIVKNLSDIK